MIFSAILVLQLRYVDRRAIGAARKHAVLQLGGSTQLLHQEKAGEQKRQQKGDAGQALGLAILVIVIVGEPHSPAPPAGAGRSRLPRSSTSSSMSFARSASEKLEKASSRTFCVTARIRSSIGCAAGVSQMVQTRRSPACRRRSMSPRTARRSSRRTREIGSI